MLLELSLKDFAIIDRVSVRFARGLNIITGETGTGKSIIIDAINTILGGRAGTEYVRTGAPEAQIEALFSLEGRPGLSEKLDSLGLGTEGGELLIKRTIPARGRGRGRVYINGCIATLAILTEVTDGLIDIFSQHEHQGLLREDRHMLLIDQFGGLEPLAARLRESHGAWRGVLGEIEALREGMRERLEKEDFLRFQAKEIDQAELAPGIDVRLEEERKVLANADTLRSLATRAYVDLYESGDSIIDLTRRLGQEFAEARAIDPGLAAVSESLEGVLHVLEDTAFRIRDYGAGVVVDEGRLEQITGHLDAITGLKRKYGDTVESILERRARIGAELGEMEGLEVRTEDLEAKAETLEAKASALAAELGERRREVAGRLEDRINGEFEAVGLKHARLSVDFRETGLTATGEEKAAFLFSANPGEGPRPMVKVASGGELSRTMLVLKEALASVEGSSVLIFDEADSGIGGAVAEAVGRKIATLADDYQVLCITHLAQVAKFAHTHLTVRKSFEGGGTKVEVTELTDEQRVEELARMMGGMSVTEKTRAAAREMLEGSSAA